MPNSKEAAAWIMDSILPLSDEANSAVNGLEAATYHELVLHEEDLIANGQLKTEESTVLNRRFRESFEEQHPVIAQLMRMQHSEHPPHHFYIPPTADDLLEEGARLKASEHLGYVYSGYLDDLARGIREGLVDDFWEEIAEVNPDYHQQIMGLRQRLKLVEGVKKNASQEEQAQLKGLFSSVSDNSAQQFLTDILISRRIVEPGIIDMSVSYQNEANKMASELGFQESWKDRDITTRQIAGAVLQGRLSINYQPPSPQSVARRLGQ